MKNLYGKDHGDIIGKIINAEKLYQQNKLYDALLEVVGVIPRLQESGDFRILFVALFLQIEILLMSGEITSTALKMSEIRAQMHDNGYDEYMPNLSALDAWAAMYDGEHDRIRKWMDNDAPDDYDEFCMLNIFQYLIKMRVYIIEEQHMALLSLAARLLPVLEAGYRYMDVCQIYMLLAISEYDMGKKESAFFNMKKTLEIAEKYEYNRLLADEGERIYAVLKEYCRENKDDEYAKKIMAIAKKVAIQYPKYLKPVRVNLSEKETAVLKLLATDLKAKEIGEKLDITFDTVKFHKKNIYRKLGVKNRDQAVAAGKKAGLV